MKKQALVVFERRQALSAYHRNQAGQLVRRRVTFGVWIDPESLDSLGLKASQNKSGRATDGALHVEIHHIEEMP